MGPHYTLIVIHELHDTPAGAKIFPRLPIKGQKLGGRPIPGNPHPFPKIVGIILPLISLWNYPAHKNCHTSGPSPPETDRILPMECVSLLSLYYGSLMISFLCEAKDPHLVPVPGVHLRPGTWSSSHAPFSCSLFTKGINKSTSCLSLCLSPDSSCAKAQRTWASLSPETSCVVLKQEGRGRAQPLKEWHSHRTWQKLVRTN